MMPNLVNEIPVRVRASNGESRDDAWIRRRLLPFRQRLLEAGKFAGLGLVGGAVILVIPLIHLLGIIFALVLSCLAAARLRTTAVVETAGGTCPRCKQPEKFFVGLGRRRFQLPTTASCERCGVELTLDRG